MDMTDNKKNVIVIITCYNRKDKTVSCIQSLYDGNTKCNMEFVIVDDNSSDGTVEQLEQIRNQGVTIHLLHGNGHLYWSGGMRTGMKYVKQNLIGDYVLLANDDVQFYAPAIDDMLSQIQEEVLVGATCDINGNMTYSGIRYTGRGVHYNKIDILDQNKECDTFNANCVLIPYGIFMQNPVIDNIYIHSLGDFDYGLSLKRNDVYLKVFSDRYIGICNNNSAKNTWLDKTLNVRDRIKRKEDIKGAPTKQWFYFLKKNFGIVKAFIYSLTPFIRIIIKR